jgi:hypothetical protein
MAMASFSPSWLDLREPVDRAARSTAVVRFVAASLPAATSLRVLDLGAGTGSNLRYLADHLPGDQRWTLVDHDPALLAEIPARVRAAGGDAELTWRVDGRLRQVSVRANDLRRLSAGLFEGVQLVTASALLDLVSDTWIASLVERCRTAGASALFALNYDGRIECTPGDPDDKTTLALVNRHQRTDKGFGPAAGPNAISGAADRFARAGYDVCRGRSDWTLGPGELELQRQLVIGWAEAARATEPSSASGVRNWQERRLAHIATGASRIRVGHEDLGCRFKGTARRTLR